MRAVLIICGIVIFFTACNTTSSRIPFSRAEYRDKNESIIYLFRERAFVGGGLKTFVFFDEKSIGLLPQLGYYPIHTTAGRHTLRICSSSFVAWSQCEENQVETIAQADTVLQVVMGMGSERVRFEKRQDFRPLHDLKNEGDYYDAVVRERMLAVLRRVILTEAKIADGKAGAAPLKIAILNFNDETKSDICGWLSASLPDAIDQSMRRDFEYLRPKPVALQKLAEQSVGKSDKDRSTALGVNLVISGRYTLNENKSTVRIDAQIYYAGTDSVLGTETIDSPLDAQIFGATKILSEKLVEKLHQLVRR